jgi:hypothetical protein
MDKGKTDRRLDLAKQVILRNQTVETYQRSLAARVCEACTSESKVSANGEDFVITLRPEAGLSI